MDGVRAMFHDLKKKYMAFDLNRDGVITVAEFRQVLEKMVGEPCPDSEWGPFIASVDANRSGTLEFEEFLFSLSFWFSDGLEDDPVDRSFALLRELFSRLDSNSDGFLSLQQVQRAIDELERRSETGQMRAAPQTAAADAFKTLGISPAQNISWRQFLHICYVYSTS